MIVIYLVLLDGIGTMLKLKEKEEVLSTKIFQIRYKFKLAKLKQLLLTIILHILSEYFFIFRKIYLFFFFPYFNG